MQQRHAPGQAEGNVKIKSATETHSQVEKEEGSGDEGEKRNKRLNAEDTEDAQRSRGVLAKWGIVAGGLLCGSVSVWQILGFAVPLYGIEGSSL